MSQGFFDIFGVILGWKSSTNTEDDIVVVKIIDDNAQNEASAVVADGVGYIARVYDGITVDTIDEVNTNLYNRFRWTDGGRGFFTGK